MIRTFAFTTAAALAGCFFLSAPASALTMKECSAKYQAAKTDGSLGTMKWNDYRAKFCGTDAAGEDSADEAAVAATPADKEPAAPTVAAPKGVTFPTAIDKKYAAETPAKGRMHTCVDAYHVNKDAGTLNGLTWIQKGGGYWSLCNSKLKG